MSFAKGDYYSTRGRQALGDISNRISHLGNQRLGDLSKRASFDLKTARPAHRPVGVSSRNTIQTARPSSSSGSLAPIAHPPRAAALNHASRPQSRDTHALPPLDRTSSRPAEPLRFEDIDIADSDNPQAVSEYVNEIYDYLRELEQKHHCTRYMATQQDINDRMRASLIDWLVDLHQRFKMYPETLFLAVNLIDRFLSAKQIALSRLQLLGIGALFVASKFEETLVPRVRDFTKATNRTCTKQDILRIEKLILQTLKFTLSVPTVLTFLKRYAKAARADTQIGMLCRFMTELSLTDYNLSTQYHPSMIAASATAHALKVVNREPWNATLQHYSGYSLDDLQPCMAAIRDLVKKSPTSRFRAVFRKYSSTRYLEVARGCVNGI
eukprot:gnl/Trimastix_PCT/3969.p1 GENE.gnl/Trimastix_PCT/3969~~gnl/Trimastix_PCT/3969.p1  ORF type:complete len:382 (+),score=130.80 gnl/Trimastix_PCT/3969:45-1190(+)